MSLADMDLAPPASSASPPRGLVGYLGALAAVAAATGLAMVIDRQAPAPNLSLVFVLPVVAAAAWAGWGPALVAALGGVLAYNYFLIAPRGTLQVEEPANVLALVLLLLTAAVVSAVAAQARRRAIEAETGAAQAAALHGLARRLVAETTREGVAERCAEALAALFRAPALVLLRDAGGGEHLVARGASPTAADLDALRWSLAAGLATRGGAYPASDSDFDVWPLTTPKRQFAAVAVAISGGRDGRPAAPERLVETVQGYLSVALDREAYAREALDGRLAMERERLQADLLAAVSHDLRTPLSAVLLTLQSLRRFEDVHDAQTRADLLESAERETARLAEMVQALLDMSRLDAGGVAAVLTPTLAADLAAAARLRAGPALAGKTVDDRTADGPELAVDAALFETALANVLENAGKYAPNGTSVTLTAGSDGDLGWIEVCDAGTGLGPDPLRLTEKFVRGHDGDGRPPGLGLGLAIARGLLEAQGGRLDLGEAPGGGARVRLWAPRADA